MTAHIHRDCIVAAAEDTSREVQLRSFPGGGWSVLDSTPRWNHHRRYRVLDHDGNVIAETPPPEPRRVRIEWDGPAPVAYARDALFVVRLSSSEGRWKALRSDGFTAEYVDACVTVGLAFATEEDAQQWADFLNQKWEVVGDE